MAPAPGTLVLVLWDDAAFDLDEAPKVLPMRTVGWLTAVNRSALTLAGEADTEAPPRYQRSFTTIPRRLVRSITVLEAGTEARP